MIELYYVEDDSNIAGIVKEFADFSITPQNWQCSRAVSFVSAALKEYTSGNADKVEAMRIRNPADYLEQVNTGKAVILSTSGENDFSKLEDEIYKTVT